MNDIDLLVGEMLGPSGVVLRGMGQELDDFVAGLGQLSGWPNYEVAFTDSEELVAAGERVLGSLEEPVSAVFLLLPLERKGVQRGQMLEAAARIAAAMPAPSQLVVMLHAPEVGSLTPGSYEEGQLFGSHLSAVVNVDPSRGRQQYFHASVRLCLVRLTSEPVAEVVFVDQEGRSWDETVEAWRSLREGKTSEAGFVLPSPVAAFGGLLPSQVDPARTGRIDALRALETSQPISELFEILVSPPHRGKLYEPEPGDDTDPADLGLVGLIDGRMLSGPRDAFVLPRRYVTPDSGVAVAAGDLVVSAIGMPVRAIEANPLHEAMVASPNTVVLRPKPSVQASDRRFVRRFIESGLFTAQLRSHGAGTALIRLRPRDFEGVMVPSPVGEIRSAFDALDLAQSRFNRWSKEADRLLSRFFEKATEPEAAAEVVHSGFLLRQRAEAAASVEKLDTRIRLRYPLPLAHRWRTANAERGGEKELEALAQTYEVLMMYLAACALTSARSAGIKVGYLANVRQQYRPGRGPSLGDWSGIAFSVAESKAFKRLPSGHLFEELRVLASDDFKDAHRHLSDLRNDLGHLRTVPHSELPGVLEATWNALAFVFEQAEFVADYPLTHVLATGWDSMLGANHLKVRTLAGDHYLVPSEELMAATSEIERDSLYIRDRRDELHLLRPLLVGKTCQDCGHWSTFAPDRRLGGDQIEYKSLEHGHVFEQAALPLLAAVGLIDC